MKARSAHNKGKRYERFLLDYFKKNVDGFASVPVGSGNGLNKGDLRLPQHNIVIEAKNQKTLKVVDWWEQCVSQAFEEIPVLIFRNPRKAEFQENLVLLSLEDFTALISQFSASEGHVTDQPEVQYTLDYETRNALGSLKNAINAVLNKIPHD